jgi:chloramphenicol-sensitive protein RarD
VSDDRLRAGIITGVASYVVWGLLTLYWKQLSRFNAFELIGWRITASAVVMAGLLTITRSWKSLASVRSDPALRRGVVIAAMLLTANWTSYVWAVVHGQVLETALGYFIAPIGTVLVGVFVLHETLRPAQWVSLGFAVASVLVLTVSYGEVPWLALLIAATWVAYGYLKRRMTLGSVPGMAAETFLLVVPAAVLAAAMGTRPNSIPRSADTTELVFALFTGVATIVPLLLFSHAAQRVPLTIIGPMQYIVPSMNFLFGWLLYHESLPTPRVVGFALVWAGLGVLTVDSARRARATRLRSATA